MKKHINLILVVLASAFISVIPATTATPVITDKLQQQSALPAIGAAEYAGANACAVCHKDQYLLWRGSHHDLAMQHASEETVLGDFNNATFDYSGIISKFYKKNKLFFVQTDGVDGNLHDYQIKYTFGVDPLQQYLIEFPGGRLQALGIAWDTREKSAGGQRWFQLYPDENITYQDRLHWTKANQNWNYMCADCHSTNLQKNYNRDTNTYSTSWSDINVACEACHGPGSNHISWADKSTGWQQLNNKGLLVNLDERAGVNWKINPETGSAYRSKTRNTNKEIEICARCHSRRDIISDDYAHDKPLMDSYQPALLSEFLYHPDGQIKEEVYVYGSFIQSKMYQKGVTCSDCHEPHSLKLRAVDQNKNSNHTCLQCHAENKFNNTSHHFHKENSAGSSCVECHMPQTKYMVIDGRHDHSIRIPRPDISVKLDTPNACNTCHKDKTAQWAIKQIKNWYGKDWDPGFHFGETLHDAQIETPNISRDLAAMAASAELPAIARATAADLLQAHPDPTSYRVIDKLLRDKDPMLRLAALQTLDTLDAPRRLQSGFGLLTDPVRAVRIETARILAAVPRELLSAQQMHTLDKAISEYRQAQYVNADRPESYINLGLLAIRLQHFTEAEKSYRQAIQLDPDFIYAYVNLADLYRLQQQDDEAEKILQQAIQISGNNAYVHHALGLLYVRNKQMEKALHELNTAYKLDARQIRFGYVYAVALSSHGQTEQAISILEQIIEQHPNNQDSLIAIISIALQQGDTDTAQTYANNLLAVEPAFGSVQKILKQFNF